ncbi:LOW QUALITY PROTEIN: dynein axonemal assembly factor 3-like [Mercenaria mercenaria]|uniref:LOW QUALITY PROTEIN: dynein axonemal assembly factor 3-like n=1 Tax=Mercenaria mercenaria TaxID=6596 RepID=UPI00234EAFAC|nr:LOW QUALITY PROTEIN: dynein axonemal assembly factor 3-like [Mercenaria mercenaria]
MTDAFGSITWWGFSPAIDLLDEDHIRAMKEMNMEDTKTRELNVLLIGAGDLRHVMMTVAKSYRHRKKKLNFYILENNLELYARDMLFLTIALEPQYRMGLQEKMELFLEIYGNILVRKQCEEYVVKMASELIKMVTDLNYLERKLPPIDLSQLKLKERDFLEAIFKFWRNRDIKGVFEVSAYWDLRQRQYLGVRYDTRTNVYDWDYNMRLSQRDAEIINSHEYRSWRSTGVAFEVREGDYDVPNKTLASGLILTQGGEKHAKRGYWGDILVSPYVPLGIQCENKSFFTKANKQFTKTSSNVAEYNVINIHVPCLYSNEPYVLPEQKIEAADTQQSAGPTVTEILEEDEAGKEQELEENEAEEKTDVKAEYSKEVKGAESVENKPLEAEYVPLPLEDVKITFLPVGSLIDLCKKSKYKELFHIIYFSNSMVHLLKPEISLLFADRATVIMESARYMLELKLEQVKMFVEKVRGIAAAAGCTPMEEFDPEKSNFIKMLFERKGT